jgi:hypothetical protein
MVPQRVDLHGFNAYASGAAGAKSLTDPRQPRAVLEQPRFGTLKATSALTVKNGERVLVGVHSLAKPERHVEVMVLQVNAIPINRQERTVGLKADSPIAPLSVRQKTAEAPSDLRNAPPLLGGSPLSFICPVRIKSALCKEQTPNATVWQQKSDVLLSDRQKFYFSPEERHTHREATG